MPRRIPCRTTTEETRQAALDVVLALMEGGPEAVTVVAIAERLPRHGAPWVYAYVGKNRLEILHVLIEREVDHRCTRLEEIANAQMTPSKRVRAVLETLLPMDLHHASLWVLVLATQMGLGQRGRLAEAVSQSLSPDMGPYTEAIGGGILGVLEGSAGRATLREELLSVITDMVMAVVLFRDVARRRGKSGN